MPRYKIALLTGVMFSALACTTAQAIDMHPTAPNAVTEFQTLLVSGKSDIAIGSKSFIQKLSDRGIGFLGNATLTQEQRQEEFRKLLHENFDMKTIGRFALGRYWKTSDKAQQTEYLKLFENMIVKVYSRRFNDYNGQALEVLEARPEGESDAIVATQIVPKSGPKVHVDWRVRNKNGEYQVVDVIVEGVSMSLTQRDDFASVIQRGGGNINILLAHLRK